MRLSGPRRLSGEARLPPFLFKPSGAKPDSPTGSWEDMGIMGLLSATTSLARYKVYGKIAKPVLDTVAGGLKGHAIPETDENVSDTVIGWTSFETPFRPRFDGSSFVVGDYLVFSLRMDKKNIPSRTIKKHCAVEEAKRMAESGRPFLSRLEKKAIREHVTNVLSLRIPPTPYVYDVIWNHEEASVWFFSTLKSANEVLESLFLKSFKIPLVRLFSYTMADLVMGLSDRERDILKDLSATKFSE